MFRAGARMAGPMLSIALCACGFGAPAPARLFPGLAADQRGHCVLTPAHMVLELRLVDAGAPPRVALQFVPLRRSHHVRIRLDGDGEQRVASLSFDPPLSTAVQACFPFSLDHTQNVVDGSIDSGGLAMTPAGTGLVDTCCTTTSKSDFAMAQFIEHHLQSIPIAFPPQPVGAGAAWMTERSVALATLIGPRTTTYRLLGGSASEADLEISIRGKTRAHAESIDQADTIVEGAGRFRLTAGAPVPAGTMRWRHRADRPDASWHESSTSFAVTVID